LVGVSALALVLLGCVVAAWHLGSWSSWWDASDRRGISIVGPSRGSWVPEQLESSRVRERSADRPVYPYSVIEGGAGNRQELRQAIDSDAVVASHFGGFDVARAKPVRLPVSKSFFVSYRKGDRVYWTRRKLTVPAGETVLSDGVNLARTRCGNRLAEDPREPIAPSEPTLVELDTPLPPSTHSFPVPFDPLTAYDLVVSSGGLPPPVTVGEGSIPSVTMPSGPFAYAWPIPWAAGPGPLTDVDHQPGFTPAGELERMPEPGQHPTPGPDNPVPIPEPGPHPTPGPDNPVPVPEPGTLLLVLPALGGPYLLRRLRGSR
jgi:hypothetical protein